MAEMTCVWAERLAASLCNRFATAERFALRVFAKMSISQLAPALLLLFPAVWTMGAIAVALATRLEFVSNLLICLALFLTGLVSQYLASQWFGEGFTSSFLRALLPNWQYFWMADALANLQKIPLSYLLWSLLYVFIYIAIWGIWALYLFQDRELAKDSR